MDALEKSDAVSDPNFGPAPDFVLTDTEGRQVRLSDFRGRRQIVLVFNRGFT